MRPILLLILLLIPACRSTENEAEDQRQAEARRRAREAEIRANWAAVQANDDRRRAPRSSRALDREYDAALADTRPSRDPEREYEPPTADVTPETQSFDSRADKIEAAIRRVGESRRLAGAGAETFEVVLHLVRPTGVPGTWEPIFQQVEVGHVLAGDMEVGIGLYRVGLVANDPRIVMRGSMGSTVYQVVWESWTDQMRRAGSPPPERIRFDF